MVERREKCLNGEANYKAYCKGDDSALAGIISEYKDGLIFYLNIFTGNIRTAEEIAEDTFVKLALKKPHYSGKASFKTWLYTIGRNMAIDSLRKARPEEVLDESALAAEVLSAEQMYLKDEQSIMVHRALGCLPADYAQAIWLVYFEDLTAKEAAAVSGKSPHAFEMLLSRAKRRLRSELERKGITTYEKF